MHSNSRILRYPQTNILKDIWLSSNFQFNLAITKKSKRKKNEGNENTIRQFSPTNLKGYIYKQVHFSGYSDILVVASLHKIRRSLHEMMDPTLAC